MGLRILLTGISGYVGTLLAHQLAQRSDVEAIIGVDMKPEISPLLDAYKSKIQFIHAELVETDKWVGRAEAAGVNVIIHTAWHIRPIYGQLQTTWRYNIEGTDAVMAYANAHPAIEQVIHFSTVASYGAFKENTIEHRYTEDEPFRKSDYLYAEEKRIAEANVRKAAENAKYQLTIIRPAAITGPFGRAQRHRFGLQSVLSGTVEGAGVYKLIKALVAVMPATRKWVRQYIHEDDLCQIVIEAMDKRALLGKVETFNACPSGEVVLPADMANMVKKNIVILPAFMIRFAFFTMWHLTQGKVPTGKAAWLSYSYPIVVDGSRATKVLGHHYKYDSREAFAQFHGKYAAYVQEHMMKK